MYVIGISPEEKSEQMELDHRHAGYESAALPLSYVPFCPGQSTTKDQDGEFINTSYTGRYA